MNAFALVNPRFSTWLMGLGFLVSIVPANAQSQSVPDVRTYSELDVTHGDRVYFSLARGEIADSTSWDVYFEGTTIGVNGGARVIDQAFERIDEAPEGGYRMETADRPAVPTDEQMRWFDYDMTTHVVTPVPMRTIVVSMKDGSFAKVEILDYYSVEGEPRYYSFRYAYQSDGSRVLGAD